LLSRAMNKPPGIPLRPDFSARPRAAIYLERAEFAAARHALPPHESASAERIAKARWNDDVSDLILRGAVSPATTPSAAVLATVAVARLVDSASRAGGFAICKVAQAKKIPRSSVKLAGG
jgi:hypothetical protein